MKTVDYTLWEKRFPHFKLHEVLSTEGLRCLRDHGKFMVNLNVLDMLEELRQQCGPLQINSAYRSPRENAKLGGADFSSHVQGTAFDVRPLKCSLDEFAAAALEIGFIFVKVDKAKNYVHCDWRSTLERKGYSMAKQASLPQSKHPVKSLSVWGSVGALTSLLALFNMLMDAYNKLPPELLQDTKAYYLLLLGAVSTGLALLGRWRAALPLWPLKK